MYGKFITFEGCEGAGKTRQIKLLENYLSEKGYDYLITREPGGSQIAEQIRKIILDKNNASMTDGCEALLYAAARIQHLEEIVLPALEKGRLVVCDRYVDSSLAYQGYARGLGFDFVEKINDFALKKGMPDATVFLNISPADAFRRKGGADESDRLELSGAEFHEKVYKGYLLLRDKYPKRIINLDCSGTKEQTHAKIITVLRLRGIIL